MAYYFILMVICFCSLNVNAFIRLWKRDYSYYNRPCLTLKETQAIGPDAHARLCLIQDYLSHFNYPLSPELTYNQYNLPSNVQNSNYNNNGYSNNIASFPSYNPYPPTPLPSYNNGYPPVVPPMVNNGIYPPSPWTLANINVPAPPSSVPVLGSIPIPDNVGIYGQPITTIKTVSDSLTEVAAGITTTPSSLMTTISSSIGLSIPDNNSSTSNSSIINQVVPLSPSNTSQNLNPILVNSGTNLQPVLESQNFSIGIPGLAFTTGLPPTTNPVTIQMLPSIGIEELKPLNGLFPTSNQSPSINPVPNINSSTIHNGLLVPSKLLQGDESTPIEQSGIKSTQPGSVPVLVPSQVPGLLGESLSNNLGLRKVAENIGNVGIINDNIFTNVDRREVPIKVAANVSAINLTLNKTCPEGYRLHTVLNMCISINQNANLVQNFSNIQQLMLTQNVPALTTNSLIVKPSLTQNMNPIQSPLDNRHPNTQGTSLLQNPSMTFNVSSNSQSNQNLFVKSSTVGPLPIRKPDIPKVNNMSKTETIDKPPEISPQTPAKDSIHSSINPTKNNNILTNSEDQHKNTRGDLLISNKVENLPVLGSKPATISEGSCPTGQVLNTIMNICVKSEAAPVPSNLNNLLSASPTSTQNNILDTEQNANLAAGTSPKDVLPNFNINSLKSTSTMNSLKNNLVTNGLINNGLTKNTNLNAFTSTISCKPGFFNFPQFSENCIPIASAFQRSLKIPGFIN